MKKISSIILLFFVLCFTVSAQIIKEELDLYQSLFGMEKKAIITDFLELDDSNSSTFWSLYDQYETERKEHGKKRLMLLSKYAEKYSELDDVTTDKIIAESITLSKTYDKIIKKYYKLIKKSVNSKAAAQFYQLELYFQSAIRISLLEQIPFIGEFDIN